MHLDLSLVLSVGIQILVCCSSIYIIIFQIPVKPTLCNLLLILYQKMPFKNFNTLNVIYNNKTCQWQKNSNTKQQNYSFLYLFVFHPRALRTFFPHLFVSGLVFLQHAAKLNSVFFPHWSVGRLVGWSTGQLVSWSVGHLVSWSLSQLVGWGFSQMVSRSVGQSVDWLVGQLVNWLNRRLGG